ncbi:MAG: endonuclease/exonuclease/phosphatase family protein [Kofleriaceae bacterium]
MRVKVMTYNVLYGFHERTEDGFVRRDERARAALAVIRAEAPDIVAFTEGAYVTADHRAVMPDLAAMCELPHLAWAGFAGDWGNVLVSRFPIVRHERLPLGTSPSGVRQSALRATIDVGGCALHVDVVHPSPSIPEADRVAAFAPLLASIEAPYVMLGDFNALCDLDDYTHEALVAQMHAYRGDAAAVATKMLDRRLLASTRAAGLVDTLPVEQRTHTIPTPLVRVGTQGARLRIDYILTTPDVRASDARVVRSPDADQASDHYPVVAVIDV